MLEIEGGRDKTTKVCITGIIAALYIVLGYAFQPISFLGFQFRIAELMVGVCIIFPWAGLIGNLLGVFILNLSSPLGILDWVLGPICNIPALLCIILLREKGRLKYIGAILYAIIIGVYVAWLLWVILHLPFFIMFLQVSISELILAVLSVSLFTKVKQQLINGGLISDGN
jgi:uncharacterized membrane protein